MNKWEYGSYKIISENHTRTDNIEYEFNLKVKFMEIKLNLIK